MNLSDMEFVSAGSGMMKFSRAWKDRRTGIYEQAFSELDSWLEKQWMEAYKEGYEAGEVKARSLIAGTLLMNDIDVPEVVHYTKLAEAQVEMLQLQVERAVEQWRRQNLRDMAMRFLDDGMNSDMVAKYLSLSREQLDDLLCEEETSHDE